MTTYITYVAYRQTHPFSIFPSSALRKTSCCCILAEMRWYDSSRILNGLRNSFERDPDLDIRFCKPRWSIAAARSALPKDTFEFRRLPPLLGDYANAISARPPD
ncbi:hypothetical protein VTO73DRAFT_9030 [Trametes versicolor]